jgi:hypothetical protein
VGNEVGRKGRNTRRIKVKSRFGGLILTKTRMGPVMMMIMRCVIPLAAASALLLIMFSSKCVLQVPPNHLDPEKEPKSLTAPIAQSALGTPAPGITDADDPPLTTPLPRYNAMLAVLRNTLYMFVFLGSHVSSSP